MKANIEIKAIPIGRAWLIKLFMYNLHYKIWKDEVLYTFKFKYCN
jgi:hypothetical protein